MARKKAKRPNGEAEPVTLNLQIMCGPETPTEYVNHAEVYHTPHEFGLLLARVQGKLPPDQLAEAKSTGVLQVNADLLLVMPPTMVVGLIDALVKQRDDYEKKFGPIFRGVKK